MQLHVDLCDVIVRWYLAQHERHQIRRSRNVPRSKTSTL